MKKLLLFDLCGNILSQGEVKASFWNVEGLSQLICNIYV